MPSSVHSTTPAADADAMSALDILRRARALIEDESHWCRKRYAVGATGRGVKPYGRWAVRWCAQGAVLGVAGEGGALKEDQALYALTTAARAAFPEVWGIPTVNDQLGHGAVLAVYDAAIAALEEEGTP